LSPGIVYLEDSWFLSFQKRRQILLQFFSTTTTFWIMNTKD
jgi:hypothetical protein